jgi:hypothetical protein
MTNHNDEGRPGDAGRPRTSAQQADRDHFSAAAEIDPFAEDHVAAGFKVDGAAHVARYETQGKGSDAILLTEDGVDAYPTAF